MQRAEQVFAEQREDDQDERGDEGRRASPCRAAAARWRRWSGRR
jgi:hypothetical protein